jgi:thiamine-phosphate pyrophosphorylase
MNHQEQFLLFGITPEVFTPRQATLVNDLFSAGLDYLYIRSEAADAAAWQELLSPIAPAFYARLLLPANAPAEAAGSEFIRHVRERERADALEQEGGPGPARSTSVHRLSRVPQLAASYQYVFFSPLFPSISKPGYQPQPGLDAVARQLADLRQTATTLPCLIGLGGIHAGNAARVKAAGFQGAALLGALWQSTCPVKALAVIRQSLG